MTASAWKEWFGVERHARWILAAAGIGYILLAAVSITFFVRLQDAETRMREFLASDDHTMFSRSGFEYQRAIQVLLQASSGPAPVSLEAVSQPIDILYNRLSIFKSGSNATDFARGLPEFNRLVAALDRALASADLILKAEPSPDLSRDGASRLLAALDAVRPELEATLGAVIASSAARRDALQSDLQSVQRLMVASVIAFAIGSLVFVGYFAFSNRQVSRRNRALKAATAGLERSEARLNAFLQNAPAFMAILDRDRRFEIVNARTEHFYGLDKAQILGRRGPEVHATPGEAELDALKQAVLETGLAQQAQICHETPRGEVWKFNVAFPIHDADGMVEAIGVIGLDISALKAAEAETIRQRVRAEEASTAKSRMLANASHELRTPLNAIIGFGQVIEAEMFGPVGTDPYKAYARDIVRSGEHLVGVIDAVLDLSRVESGQLGLAVGRVHPNDIMSAAFTLVQAAAAKAGLALDIRRDDALPALMVDGPKLTQVLVNLLSNAIKFTNSGGRVTLAARADGDGFAFVVADTGVGIAESELQQVVLPFTRGGSAMVRGQEGTGLGLAIAKALVEQHDGAMVIASRLGAGTEVTVRLPAACVVTEQPQGRVASRIA